MASTQMPTQMPTQIVIYVHRGQVHDVFCSDEFADVLVVEGDARAPRPDAAHLLRVPFGEATEAAEAAAAIAAIAATSGEEPPWQESIDGEVASEIDAAWEQARLPCG